MAAKQEVKKLERKHTQLVKQATDIRESLHKAVTEVSSLKQDMEKIDREVEESTNRLREVREAFQDAEDEIPRSFGHNAERGSRSFVRNEQAFEDLETKSLGLLSGRAVTGSVAEQIEDLEDAAGDQLQLAAGNEALAKENRATANDQMQLAKGHEALAKENRQQAKEWQREADQLKRQ